MKPGCCSSISPCSHQQKDPDSLCKVCEDAKRFFPPGLHDELVAKMAAIQKNR